MFFNYDFPKKQPSNYELNKFDGKMNFNVFLTKTQTSQSAPPLFSFHCHITRIFYKKLGISTPLVSYFPLLFLEG